MFTDRDIEDNNDQLNNIPPASTSEAIPPSPSSPPSSPTSSPVYSSAPPPPPPGSSTASSTTAAQPPGSGGVSSAGGNSGTAAGNSAVSSSPSSSSTTGAGSGGSSLSSSSSTLTTSFSRTTITSAIPVSATFTSGGSTFTSVSESLTTITTSTAIVQPTGPPRSALSANSDPVCLGHGIDIQAVGVLEAVILPSVVGLLIWLLFAFLRPRFRQLYAAREWFPRQEIRPEPLNDTFWAFLFPHVPFVPSLPSESDLNNPEDTTSIPSDSQLSQRVLYISFRIVLAWTILGLAGALPLYLINTPCLKQSSPPSHFVGLYSSLQDLSVLRLLQLLEDGNIATTNNLQRRAVVDGSDVTSNTRTRLIILTVFTLVLAMLPALYKLLKEFTKHAKYRRHWLDVRCQGMELGWLGAHQAPGFVGWGEKRLKEFVVKTGLSASLERSAGIGVNGNMAGVGAGYRGRTPSQGNSNGRGQNSNSQLGDEEIAELEIDIMGLFTIGDTGALAELIAERDFILNNLEEAETEYIASFRLSTPEPSLAEPPPLPPKDEHDFKRQISRPRALAGHPQRRTGRLGRQSTSSPTTPTSYVAPSQYYKLRGVRGISGGRFSSIIGGDGARPGQGPSFGESVRSRIVGSRFQEVNRDSEAYGRLPLGSSLEMTRGQLGPVSPLSDTPLVTQFGVNYEHDPSLSHEAGTDFFPSIGNTPDLRSSSRGHSDDNDHQYRDSQYISERGSAGIQQESPFRISDFETARGSESGNGHVYEDGPDELEARPRVAPVDFGTEEGNDDSRLRRVPAQPADRRESFPMRRPLAEKDYGQLPLHLRVQQRGPFVRPLSYLDHEDLGNVYNAIRNFRTQLKLINAQITDSQNDCFNDIADGSRIKGWLLTGRGIRFIPGIQMIEGRSKDDILWDELQQNNAVEKTALFWSSVVMAGILLGAGLIAVSGLALTSAPDVAHFLSFLQPLMDTSKIAGGLAIVLVPAIVATVFFIMAIATIQFASKHCGSISVTSAQLVTYKATFLILMIIGTIWFIAVGAVIFAIDAFSESSERTANIANGSIYMSAFFFALVINAAIIAPGLLLLQPARLRRLIKSEKNAITPRQRFRAIYPRAYDPTYATACCILAVILASTFSLIFPLIGPAVVLLLFLTIVAHRFLVGYVYGRTEAQTGGLQQLWLLKRFATVVTFQPILLGLIFLTRRLWIEGGILAGIGVACILFVEAYTVRKLKQPSRKSLSSVTQNSLDTFEDRAKPGPQDTSEEGTSLVSSQQRTRPRGSLASVLEMMSLTLAVMPAPYQMRHPVPLDTESLDDQTATERAALTHPDAPPHLPDLSFVDHADEMASILYAPELIAPQPIIWLPNDPSGIARSEAYDLQEYFGLRTVLDVRSPTDVLPRRSSSRSKVVS